jgi:hypothetical protein
VAAWLQAQLGGAEQTLAEAHELAGNDVAEGVGVLARLLDRDALAEQDRQAWIATLRAALDTEEAKASPALSAWLHDALRDAGAGDPPPVEGGPGPSGGEGGEGGEGAQPTESAASAVTAQGDAAAGGGATPAEATRPADPPEPEQPGATATPAQPAPAATPATPTVAAVDGEGAPNRAQATGAPANQLVVQVSATTLAPAPAAAARAKGQTGAAADVAAAAAVGAQESQQAAAFGATTQGPTSARQDQGLAGALTEATTRLGAGAGASPGQDDPLTLDDLVTAEPVGIGGLTVTRPAPMTAGIPGLDELLHPGPGCLVDAVFGGCGGAITLPGAPEEPAGPPAWLQEQNRCSAMVC